MGWEVETFWEEVGFGSVVDVEVDAAVVVV